MRGYGEVVDVLTDEEGQPRSFVWRGRRYRVTGLLQTWHEIVPWWREAALMELAEPTAESTSSVLLGERIELDRRLWRVEAAPGQAAYRGVFDLASTARGWSLERLGD